MDCLETLKLVGVMFWLPALTYRSATPKRDGSLHWKVLLCYHQTREIPEARQLTWLCEAPLLEWIGLTNHWTSVKPSRPTSYPAPSKMIDHNALVNAMMCYSEQQFIRALRKEPERRSMQVRQAYYKVYTINILCKCHTRCCNYWCNENAKHPARGGCEFIRVCSICDRPLLM